MDNISFPYRSAGHLALLHVVSESGSWAKHGLNVNYNYQISSSDAHDLVPKGEVEFVGGNHVSSYAARVHGDTWVYLGQTLNQVNIKLVVRPDSGINGVSDLREKVVATSGSDAIAFRNPNGSIVTVMYNAGAAKTTVVSASGKRFQFSMPGSGWATVVSQ